LIKFTFKCEVEKVRREVVYRLIEMMFEVQVSNRRGEIVYRLIESTSKI